VVAVAVIVGEAVRGELAVMVGLSVEEPVNVGDDCARAIHRSTNTKKPLASMLLSGGHE